jgi:hypothetical protein
MMFRVKRHETSEIFTAQIGAGPYILQCVRLGKYPLSYSAAYRDRSREDTPRGILHGIPRDMACWLRKPVAEECEKHKDASKRD